ncbi:MULTISPECIES: ATP-grasp domain-containing protein [unclassified Agarivorans]|uniref:ATP-grasp domain-containing protein n=1 Tax=unclassified Agarivorans TaxID=2636026 RepID=UPI003D7E52B3
MGKNLVDKNGPTIGMWMYQNSGGDTIQNNIIKQLAQRGINVITGLDLAQASAQNGEIICNGIAMEQLDLFFSYNAGQQTPFQMYLYQAINKLVPTINNFEAFSLSEDKFLTAYALNQAGIRSADYRLFNREDFSGLRDTVREWNGRVVYKPTDGWGGTGIVKIEDERSLDVLVPFLNRLDVPHFYLEKYINYDKTDYRVDVVDGKYIGCYGRKAPTDSWKTNITSGGSVITRHPSDEVIELAIQAAKVTGLEIAGVDLLYDLDTEEYVVLEVNGIPAFATPEQEKLGIDFNSRKIDAIVELVERTIFTNTQPLPLVDRIEDSIYEQQQTA